MFWAYSENDPDKETAFQVIIEDGSLLINLRTGGKIPVETWEAAAEELLPHFEESDELRKRNGHWKS